MNLKSVILYLTISITLFSSYNALKPFEDYYERLNTKHYSLSTNNTDALNKWAKFKDEGDGIFFVHPGENKAVTGLFKFYSDKLIKLDFSIRDNKYGNIKFTTIHNQKTVDTSIVTYNSDNKLLINIKNGDSLEIIADKNGKTSFDWGNLKISVMQSSFFLDEILTPMMWSIFFILMIHTKHLFLALNSFMIFTIIIITEKLNFITIQAISLVNYTLLIFCISFILLVLHQKRIKFTPVISILFSLFIYIIPLFFIVYILNFNAIISKDILYAVFQSNSIEAYEYISDYIDFKYIFLVILIILFSITFIFLQNRLPSNKINNKVLLIVFLLLITFTPYKDIMKLELPNFIIANFTKYFKELEKFKEVQKKRKTQAITFQADKKTQGETYIIIIGESLNKNHMGVYGYFRDTTPHLSSLNANKELLVFDNVYSNHTHTVPVLSLSLTEANQYNGKTYFESLSILEILNKAGFETYWLSNQVMYGGWDNMVSAIAIASDNLIAMNSSIGYSLEFQKHDGALIEKVQNILKTKSDKNRAIFLHLMGSHSKYESKYPKDLYSKYQEPLTQIEVGYEVSTNEKINHYDNSVLYNDFVVSSVLDALKREKKVSGLIYMSDHADDVIKDYGHSIDKFTYEMTQIPMIFWFSDKYKQSYNQKYTVLSNNTHKLFSNDLLYDTLIGVFDINTDKYNKKFDFSSEEFLLKEDEALVIHGKKHYNNHENYIYWQEQNIKFLLENNLSSKVIPHNIKSKAKEKEVYNSGFTFYDENIKNMSEVYKSSLSLKDPFFQKKLLTNQAMKDKNINYITVDFESQFD